MTIPGIGFVNGGIILGEIGEIHRFSSPSKLLAYAGLDPSIYQSGNFQARRTRMSKRSSRTLRYALMNVAHNVVKNNDTFKTFPYYQDVTSPMFLNNKYIACLYILSLKIFAAISCYFH